MRSILQQAETGAQATDLCRQHGMGEATFYKWKAKSGGLQVSAAQKLRRLEEENAKLKRVVADLTLDNVALKDLLGKKW
jgi:putative transposase